MKICIACGMPMEKLTDYPMMDLQKDYCIYCAKEDGSMLSFEEKKKSLGNFILKTQGFDKDKALIMAENMMKKLPAWKAYFE